jgi:integrase
MSIAISCGWPRSGRQWEPPTSAPALRFFFKITLKRHDLAEELISTREPRRLPVVLSPEEVGRLLAAATNIKHRAILSLAYATGLRASEVVSLNSRLVAFAGERVTFKWKDYRAKADARYKLMTLDPTGQARGLKAHDEFIRRFLSRAP